MRFIALPFGLVSVLLLEKVSMLFLSEPLSCVGLLIISKCLRVRRVNHIPPSKALERVTHVSFAHRVEKHITPRATFPKEEYGSFDCLKITGVSSERIGRISVQLLIHLL